MSETGSKDRLDRARAAPRCGARTRRGTSCMAPAMKNGRCMFHGGKSTGPRTKEGVERLRAARTTHGAYSAEAKHWRRKIRALLALVREDEIP
jgi:hypothetical protein